MICSNHYLLKIYVYEGTKNIVYEVNFDVFYWFNYINLCELFLEEKNIYIMEEFKKEMLTNR